MADGGAGVRRAMALRVLSFVGCTSLHQRHAAGLVHRDAPCNTAHIETRMWNNRFDDLWMYPLPNWFVRLCNRFIGSHVLELIVVSEVIGLVLFLLDFFSSLVWLQVVGYALIAPGPLLIILMIIIAQVRMRLNRHKVPLDPKQPKSC